jgi:LysR family glycine cleavage system transcriptional activator
MLRAIPPLSSLRCFEVAARLQSFTSAADALCLTPSAVSHQIKVLESFLGRQLFIRMGRRMLLTDDGKAYVSRIAEAFRQIELATDDMTRRDAVEMLVVSVAPSFASVWLVPRLANFIRAHPHIRLKLVTSPHPANMVDDAIDCEVRYGHGKWSNLAVEALWSERLTPICSTANAALLKSQGLSGLARTTLIHTRSRLNGWGEFGRRHGIELGASEEGLQVDRTPLALEAARSGVGVALESVQLAASLLRDGSLVTPLEESIDDETYFFVHGRHEPPAKVAIFKAWLRQQIDLTAAAAAADAAVEFAEQA